MKKFRNLFFASLLFFITGNVFAQQATLNDYAASWTGTGSDGNSYVMTLNRDNSASLKRGSNTIDVVGWKLNHGAGGSIVYDHGHAVMRLISNVMINMPASNQATSVSTTGTNGTAIKIYYADVFYNIKNNTLNMVVDFNTPNIVSPNKSGITITFTK